MNAGSLEKDSFRRAVIERSLIAVLALKILFGLAGYAWNSGEPDDHVFLSAIVLSVLTFATVAVVLLTANRGDPRANALAFVFLATSAAFANSLMYGLQPLLTRWFSAGLTPFFYFRPDACLPVFLWIFAQDFPKLQSGRGAGWASAFIKLSVGIASLLFISNLAVLALTMAQMPVPAPLIAVSAYGSGSLYWTLLFGLSLPSLPFVVWKARSAEGPENRRVTLFVLGIALGTAPLILIVLTEGLSPSFHAFMSNPPVRYLSGFLVYPALLSVPITTAYSVLVHRVLDVRIIVRKALQYALARYTVSAVTAAPLFALAAYIYRNRERTVTDLLTGQHALILMTVSILGLVTLRTRHRILANIDRMFFREQYDATKILTQVAASIPETGSAEELTTVLSSELERAFHPESVYLLILDPMTAKLRCTRGAMRGIDSTGELAEWVSSVGGPVEIDHQSNIVRQLPIADREWLAEGNIRLIAPLVGSEQGLLGIIAMGERKSELPFSAEDRSLVRTISNAAARTVEQLINKSTISVGDSRTPDHAKTARLCPSCKAVREPGSEDCADCQKPLADAEVPFVLIGKFRFERVIGAGGMGVVYRAFDLGLHRTVAIKTLPRLSPEYAVHLRREARAIASVKHPNLAVIYGVESWHGRPMLVFEYLPGGNLAERIRSGPLSLSETLRLGILMADVLDVVHARGVLHRDIKPSNIAYQDQSTPKLLDFGLAHIMRDRISDGFDPRRDWTGETVTTLPADQATKSFSYLAGTPQYMSPEAFRGRDDVTSDIWATCMVLYECLAGKNPMLRPTISETVTCVVSQEVPDIRRFLSDCPQIVSEFFQDAFAKQQDRRPADARTLGSQLRQLQTSICPREAPVDYRAT